MNARNAPPAAPHSAHWFPRLLAGALLLAAAVPAEAGREEVTRKFEKSLPLAAGQRVSIDHSNGSVSVATHREPLLKIDATIRVSSSDREGADKFAQDIRIEVTPTAAGVSVRTIYPEKKWTFLGGGHVSYAVDYTIVMPEAAPLTLRNRFGNVAVENLKAAGDIVNSNGKVSFRGGGGAQRLENSFGSIEVTGNDGDAVIVNSNGLVTVTDVTGELDVRNRFAGRRSRGSESGAWSSAATATWRSTAPARPRASRRRLEKSMPAAWPGTCRSRTATAP